MSIIFQALNISANYAGAWSKKKNNIILFRIFSAIFNALAILTAGNVIPAIPVFFTIVRNIVCYFKDKFKSNKPIWLITFGYVCIILYSIPNIESMSEILPSFISIVTAIVIWFGTSSHIKICSSIGNCLWTLYYISDGIYLTACYNIIQLVLELVTLVRININKQTKD